MIIIVTALLLISAIDAYSGIYRTFMHSFKPPMCVRSGLIDTFTSSEEIRYRSVVATGFLTKASSLQEFGIFSKLCGNSKIETIKAVSEDLILAKRLTTSPSSVYSGFANKISFKEVDYRDLNGILDVLSGQEVWLANNVSIEEIESFTNIATRSGISRVIFLVNIPPEYHLTPNLTFDKTAEAFKVAGIHYTILKYSRQQPPSSYQPNAFRVQRGDLPLGTLNAGDVASEDLYKVAAEIIDIPKTFDSVYGIIRGNELDREIASYMASCGWPERVKIGVLVGDVMERVEQTIDCAGHK